MKIGPVVRCGGQSPLPQGTQYLVGVQASFVQDPLRHPVGSSAGDLMKVHLKLPFVFVLWVCFFF